MIRSLRIAIAAAVLLAAAALLASTLLPRALGYETYVITGRSMEPAIERGSIVVSEVVPVAALRRGDVITYVPPDGRRRITHRITEIDRRGEEPVLRTRGDNSPAADPWRFTLDAGTQARMTAAIPYLGWALIALGDPLVRLLALVLPALAIALVTLAGLWRRGGELVEARRP